MKHLPDCGQSFRNWLDTSLGKYLQGLENKFIGKNFVFDHRRAEKISEDVIANCHQCGKPCDTHVNCANEACHLLFIQCESCKEEMENCWLDCLLQTIRR